MLSIIGRFLEHARIFHFAAGQTDPLAGEFYIGSADWMSRNLKGRVEVITPVEDAASRARLWEILDIQRQDQRQGWDLQPDGSYIQRHPSKQPSELPALGSHELLMQRTTELARQSV